MSTNWFQVSYEYKGALSLACYSYWSVYHRHANLGCPVPQGHHLVGVHSDGDPEGSSQPEVGDLDAAVLVDEKILGLHVSMENSPLVTEQDALQQLNSEQLFQLCIKDWLKVTW